MSVSISLKARGREKVMARSEERARRMAETTFHPPYEAKPSESNMNQWEVFNSFGVSIALVKMGQRVAEDLVKALNKSPRPYKTTTKSWLDVMTNRYRVMWRGQQPEQEFMWKDDAEAYIARCNAAGRLV